MVNDVDYDAMREQEVEETSNPFYGRPKCADKILGPRRKKKD